MEPPYEEHHSQYPMERSPNAYRSMRDYRNPPWVSAPFCTDPPTNVPYGNTYNHSWRNHPNFSWKSRPPQYTPPTPPYYASTPQPPQPPQLSSSVEQVILNLSKLVDTFIEEQKEVNVQTNQKIDTGRAPWTRELMDFKAKLIINFSTCRNQFQGSPISMIIKRKRIWRKSA